MIIKSVQVINHDKVIKNADVEIKNGKIFAIKEKKGTAKKLLVPGFIDQHIHGFSGKDAMDGTEAIEFMSKELVKSGTTAFLPTMMTAKNLLSALKNGSKAKTMGSKILGIHLEGPFISKEKKGAHDEKYIQKATAKRIKDFTDAANGTIRKITIGPENFPIKLLPELFKNNIIPSIGHSNATGKVTQEYIDAGVSSATHLWNAMSSVANRNPGIAETVLISDNVTTEMILDFVHVDKEAAKLSIAAKGVETISLVTDAIRPAGLPDGNSTSGGLKVTKKGNLITLKGTNTIAGSGATMLDNFKHVIALGFDLETAVALTSYNAAALLGEEKLGYIAKGNTADLVLLDSKLNLKSVFVNGEEKYNETNNR